MIKFQQEFNLLTQRLDQYKENVPADKKSVLNQNLSDFTTLIHNLMHKNVALANGRLDEQEIRALDAELNAEYVDAVLSGLDKVAVLFPPAKRMEAQRCLLQLYLLHNAVVEDIRNRLDTPRPSASSSL